jgi:hypothetical protein
LVWDDGQQGVGPSADKEKAKRRESGMPGKKQGRCSPEQVKKCHGTAKSRSHLRAPDGDPRKCSPEQIRECHGDVKKHPCVGK